MVWTDGFEDGSLDEWTRLDTAFSATTSFARNGQYSAGVNVTASTTTDFAYTTPDGYAGGRQPTVIQISLRENSMSAGSGVRLQNSNGDYEAGFATNNPEWFSSFSTGVSQFYGGDGYDRWLQVRFEFDWSAGEVTLWVRDPETDTIQTTTGSLRHGVDIEAITFSNFAAGSWDPLDWGGGTSDCMSWIDDLSLYAPHEPRQGRDTYWHISIQQNDWTEPVLVNGVTGSFPSLTRGETVPFPVRTGPGHPRELRPPPARYRLLRELGDWAGWTDTTSALQQPAYRERIPGDASVDSLVVRVDPAESIPSARGVWGVVNTLTDSTQFDVAGQLELGLVVLAEASEYGEYSTVATTFGSSI